MSVLAALCVILKSFLVLSTLLPKKKATKMCRGWTTEVHWQPGDSPKWFYCKRLTDGHTSYFPRTCSGRRSVETILVGIRPRSQLVPRGAGRREWIRFGKRRGRSSWMVAMPGPRSIMNSCATALLSWVRAGYKRAASRDLAKTNDTPELLQSPMLRQQSIIDFFCLC